MTLAVPSAAQEGQTDTEWTDPTVIAVPYLDEVTVPLNEAWTLTECPTLAADGVVEVSCTDEGEIVLRAVRFVATSPTWPLLISIVNSVGENDVLALTVTLAAPPPVELSSELEGIVGVAGGRTLIPVSALVQECTLCTEGVTLDVSVVEDDAASGSESGARAWVSSHHLVIDAPSDAVSVTLSVAAADDTGVMGTPTELEIPMTSVVDPTAVGIHLLGSVGEGGSLTLTAKDLVLSSSGSWTIERCGTAVAGGVSCSPDGLTYTSSSAALALADQVWVRLRSDQGDVVMSSISIAGSLSAAQTALAPAAPGAGGAALVAVRAPAQADDGVEASDPGVLAGMWSLLPALGIPAGAETAEPSPTAGTEQPQEAP